MTDCLRVALLAAGLDLGLLHCTPGVVGRIPDLAASTRVAGDPLAVPGDQLLADEVQGVKVLREDDDPVAAGEQVVRAGP